MSSGWDDAFITTKVILFYGVKIVTYIGVVVASLVLGIMALAASAELGIVGLLIGICTLLTVFFAGLVGRDSFVYLTVAKFMFSEADLAHIDKALEEGDKE